MSDINQFLSSTVKVEELRTPPLSPITWVQFLISTLMSYGYLSFSRTYFFHLHKKIKWDKQSMHHLTYRKPSINAYHYSSTHSSDKQFIDGAVTFHLEFIFGNFISWKFIFFSFERVIFLMSQNSQHNTKLYKIYEEFTLLGIKYAGKVTMHPIFQSQSHPAHTYHSSLLINSIPFLSKVTWVWIINYVIPYTYMVCLDLRL